MIRLVPRIAWGIGPDPVEPLDERLLPLLEAIARTSSLAAAVAERRISYRAAWGLLRDYERKLGTALVLLERGRGASLAPAGETLLRQQQAATRRLARAMPELLAGPGARAAAEEVRAPSLRVAASHDLALVALAETLPDEAALRLEISFTGSLPAIREFAEGRADVAGFHVPAAGCDALQLSLYRKLLRERRDRLIPFVEREQGLILPRGNPQRVRRLGDVAAKRLRFVNRQRGSGTRLLIDQLMQDEGVDPAAFDGYRREEYTHVAVAATVASGGADAGVGLRAAAAEYRLAFVPLLRERYFFAVRARELRSPAVVRLIGALGGSAFNRTLDSLAGYRAAGGASVVGVDALG